jgi:hypothetical protein
MSRPALIGLHGAPRSGTSWLGALFDSSEQVAYRFQPFFAYAFRGRIGPDSSASDIARFFDDLFATGDAFVTQSGEARLARQAPAFVKRHPTRLVYKEVRFHHLIEPILAAVPDARYVGIVRDPRSVLASWFAAPREFKAEWSKQAEWRRAPAKNAGLDENWYGYERWKELSLLFLDLAARFPDRFRLVRYEDLVQSTEAVTGSLFDFCGLVAGEQTIRFIRESTTRDDGDPYGVFRQRDSLRANESLPAEIAAAIESDLVGSALQRFLEPPTAPIRRAR